MRALSMKVAICECGDLIGVDLVAADGKTFGHGHLDLAEAEKFLGWFAEGVAHLRERAGKKPS